MGYISAIIVAAGRGTRMKAETPKQFLELNGYSILYHTLQTFANAEKIDEIVLVVANEYIRSPQVTDSLPNNIDNKNYKIVSGGDSRQESVYKGLKKVHENTEIVLVHDGVRPLITEGIINKNIEKCSKHDCVLTALPSIDTLKKVQDKKVVKTLDRDEIWGAQTPQTFKKEVLMNAYQNAIENGYNATDDSELVESVSDVRIVMGNKYNIKITHKEDLKIAKAILESRN